MNIELGGFETADEAAYAYNVALKITRPDAPLNSFNYGMMLTEDQKKNIEVSVKEVLRTHGIDC